MINEDIFFTEMFSKRRNRVVMQQEPETFYCTSSTKSVYKHWQKDELNYKTEATPVTHMYEYNEYYLAHS